MSGLFGDLDLPDAFAAKAVEAERAQKIYFLHLYCEEYAKARKTRRALDAILDCDLSVKEMARVENLAMAQKHVRGQRKELKRLWKRLAAERERCAEIAERHHMDCDCEGYCMAERGAIGAEIAALIRGES